MAAAVREPAGDSFAAAIESPHPVDGRVWRQEVTVPGASFVKLRLGELSIGEEDLLLVHDGAGSLVFSHVGPMEAGSWLPAADGQTAIVELWPAEGSKPWGLWVDEVGRGFGAREGSAAEREESVCGMNDSRDPACYDAGRRALGDAVGRMLFQASDGYWYVCTGSLISPYGHFLTNNHCISQESEAQTLEVRWRYQLSGCASGSVSYDSVTAGSHLLSTQETLDYSLLVFDGDDPQSRYGHLDLSTAKPAVGTRIWIPQHPGGNPKKFAVTSDLDGGDATLRKVGVKGNGAHTDVAYTADTEGGSSGSPVLDDGGLVVALHHFGTGSAACAGSVMNQGVRMDKIYPAIHGYLGAPQVTSIRKLGNPFRIEVRGAFLSPGIRVTIDGTEWTSVKVKGEDRLLLKGGSSLKSAVPRDTPVTFHFENPYVPGGDTVTWQWP
jgi:S1-C subfamily serine protease